MWVAGIRVIILSQRGDGDVFLDVHLFEELMYCLKKWTYVDMAILEKSFI